MPLKKRTLEAQIILDPQLKFPSGSGEIQITTDAAMEFEIIKDGMDSLDSVKAVFYNLSEDTMHTLTSLVFKKFAIYANQLTLLAGYDDVKAVVFKGIISRGIARYGNDRVLTLEAMAAYGSYMSYAPPKSYNGSTKIQSIMQEICSQEKLQFKDEQTPARFVNDQVLTGSPVDRLFKMARAANFIYSLSDGIFTIADKIKKDGKQVIVISSETGLLGWPEIDDSGIKFKCLFNPAIQNGAYVKIESSVKWANDTWRIYAITQKLQNFGNDFYIEVMANHLQGT